VSVLFHSASGQTPLDPDEAEGLLLDWIVTRADLDLAEQQNIEDGILRLSRRRLNVEMILDDSFLKSLHQTLFGSVWAWAGKFRTTERNVGVPPHAITTELRKLMDDVMAWRQFGTFDADEQAVRLHHRLTWIHPFPNGNGRTARIYTDSFLMAAGGRGFTWGGNAEDSRTRYLEAIRAADRHDLDPLRVFVRSCDTANSAECNRVRAQRF